MVGIVYDKVEKYGKKQKFLISEDGQTKCQWSKFTDFEIICSDCGEVCHIKKPLKSHINNIFYCKKCRSKGERNGMFGKHLSEEAKKKISEHTKGENNYWFGKHLPDDVKKKLSERQKGKYVGENNPMFGKNAWKIYEEHHGVEALEARREHYRQMNSGKNNPYFGKKHSPEVRKKISNSLKNSEKFHKLVASLEFRKKLSNSLKHSKKLQESRRSEEYRQKKREQWSKGIVNGTHPRVSFNSKACKVFDYIMKRDGIFIQHALNGGEYLVEGLGFWLDGYDAINNVAYEYDERWHFVGGQLRKKDLERQKMIEEKLGCKFIRIKDGDYDEFI